MLAALVAAPYFAGSASLLGALIVISLLTLALGLRVWLPVGRRQPLRVPAAGCAAMLLAALAFLSLAVSVNRGETVRAATTIAGMAGLLVLAADARWRPGGPERILLAIALGGGIVAIAGMQEYAIHLLVEENASWRVFSRFYNPNLFASYLLVAIPLVAAAFLRSPAGVSDRWPLLPGLLLWLLCAALFPTGSRAGLYIFGGLVALYPILEWWKGAGRSRRWVLRALAMGLVIGLTGAALSRVFVTRAQGEKRTATVSGTALDEICPLTVGEEGQSFAFRRLTWRGTVRMVRARPLLGFGAGSFPSIYPKYAIAGFTRMAHQSYLQIAAEMGALALLAWLATLLLALAAWIRQPKAWWMPGVAAAVAAALIHNLVDSPWYVVGTAMPVWALLGLAAAPPAEPRAAEGSRVGSQAVVGTVASFLMVIVIWQIAGRVQASFADFLVGSGRLYAGQKALRRATRILPLDADLQYDLARLSAVMGDAREGLDAARRAVELAPTRPPLRHRYALALAAGRDVEAAEREFRTAIGWGPGELPIRWALVELLRRQRRNEEALVECREILKVEQSPVEQVKALGAVRDHRYALAHLFIASQLERQGDPEGAHQEYVAAACRLRERRLNFEINRAGNIIIGGGDPAEELQLVDAEAGIWRRLFAEFEQQGRGDLAEAVREQLQDLAERRANLSGERGRQFLLEGN